MEHEVPELVREERDQLLRPERRIVLEHHRIGIDLGLAAVHLRAAHRDEADAIQVPQMRLEPSEQIGGRSADLLPRFAALGPRVALDPTSGLGRV